MQPCGSCPEAALFCRSLPKHLPWTLHACCFKTEPNTQPSFHSLQTLRLAWCVNISDVSVNQLALHCPLLQTLEVGAAAVIVGAAQGVMQPAAARPGQSVRSERLQRGAAVQVRCLPPASRSTSASPHSLYNQPPVVLCLIPLRLPQQAHLHRRARLPRNRPKVCGHDQYAAA